MVVRDDRLAEVVVGCFGGVVGGVRCVQAGVWGGLGRAQMAVNGVGGLRLLALCFVERVLNC